MDSELGVYAVADGMGGHAAGEVASGIAIRTLSRVLRSDNGDWSDTSWVAAELRRAIDQANHEICDSVEAREEWRGMGTTLVALSVAGLWLGLLVARTLT